MTQHALLTLFMWTGIVVAALAFLVVGYGLCLMWINWLKGRKA